jgi:4'-phosphopantetheinyl transferase
MAIGMLEGGMRWPLGEGEVHIWRSRLGQTVADRSVLSAGERARADGLLAGRTRERFIAARAGLRRILAGYAGADPASLEFVEGRAGKPRLVAPRSLCFNLSHCADLALVAVGLNVRLGIDVERMRPVARVEELARRYFHPGEHAALMQIPPQRRSAAFLRCWTRKEALVKAAGGAIFGYLKRRRPLSRRWWVSELDAGHGYVAALACGRRGITLRYASEDGLDADHEQRHHADQRVRDRDADQRAVAMEQPPPEQPDREHHGGVEDRHVDMDQAEHEIRQHDCLQDAVPAGEKHL